MTKDRQQYVIRNQVRTNFTTFSNDLLRDENLSWRARGILVYMLSLPEDWVFYDSEIMKHSKKEGRDAFRTAMKELKDNGYVRKEAIKDEKGKIIKWATYVNSEPLNQVTENQNDQITENPECGQATLWDDQSVDNPTLQSTYLSTKELKEQNNNNTNKDNSIPSEMEDAQKVYEHYMSKNIIKHEKFTNNMKTAVNARLKDFPLDVLIQVIDNYEIVFNSEKYYFKQRYTLIHLMREKDVLQFSDAAQPLTNFLKNKNTYGGNQYGSNTKSDATNNGKTSKFNLPRSSAEYEATRMRNM